MQVTAETIGVYVRHAFAGMERVLDRLDDDLSSRRTRPSPSFGTALQPPRPGPADSSTSSWRGRRRPTIPCEFMPGTDRSDGALVLHVLEELFQHLGHMEVTADALGESH